MSEPMSEARLAEMAARVQAATEGPWIVVAYTDDHADGPPERGQYVLMREATGGRHWDSVDSTILSPPNAEFIAHARQDVPDLLVEVQRLQGELARASQHLLNRHTCDFLVPSPMYDEDEVPA